MAVKKSVDSMSLELMIYTFIRLTLWRITRNIRHLSNPAQFLMVPDSGVQRL